MRIVLTGGGTGGHLIPFEPIIESLRAYYIEQKQANKELPDNEPLSLYFVGVANEGTKKFFARYDIAVTNVSSGKLRRYVSHLNISDMLLRLPIGILKALWVIWKIMPDVVLSKGGYGSIPIIIAARFYRIPVIIHESDAVSGLANRLAARVASAIAVGFEETKDDMKKFRHKTFVTGTPVRSQFGHTPPAIAKRNFGFNENEMVVLVIGGSQGAEQLNEVILQILPKLVLKVGIIHITGEANFTTVSIVAKELLAPSSRKDHYKLYPYLIDTVSEAMAASDIVVSRAGATTLAEITKLRKPSLLIPLAGAANNHQRLNAQIFERVGAARVLETANLTKNIFERSLFDIIDSPDLQREMSINVAKFDHPQAARDIVELTFKLANGLRPQAPPSPKSKATPIATPTTPLTSD